MKVIGLARRPVSRAPMQEMAEVEVTPAFGVEGDCKGIKFPSRQVTVLAIEDWHAALLDLAKGMQPPDLPWTTRRANVLLEGLALPRGIGSCLQLGDILLEVTAPTTPCAQMDAAYPGLRLALAPHWRGGVTCKVLRGGLLQAGDPASVTKALPERKVHLPG
jgi:MOSC domain-containing protein YiiM